MNSSGARALVLSLVAAELVKLYAGSPEQLNPFIEMVL